MTVWGSSLQIGCRLILLISEHPIQQGIRKECWHRIPGNGTEFLAKWRSLRKKVSLTPKKWKFGSKKKNLSPNPSGHGLFAKNCIKIGLVWPQQLHFWSTGAYRGFPPYAIFPLPDTKKYSIVLCYVKAWSHPKGVIFYSFICHLEALNIFFRLCFLCFFVPPCSPLS